MMNRHLAPLFSRQVVSGGLLTQQTCHHKANSLDKCKMFLKDHFQPLSSRQNSSSFAGMRTGCVARQSSFSSSNQSKINVYVYLSGERSLFTVTKPLLAVKTFKLADIGEGIAQVELLKWHKKVGDDVEEMDDLCAVQSDKATVEITCPYTGKIVKLHQKEGTMVKIGSPLLDIDVEEDEEEAEEQPKTEDEKPKTPEPVTPSSPAPSSLPASSSSSHRASSSSTVEVSASPATRRFAKEKGIDLSLVKGTGRHGLVTKEDVINFLNRGGVSESAGGSSHHEHHSSGVSTAGGHGATTGEESSKLLQRPERKASKVQLRGFSRPMVKAMNESVKVPQLNIGDEFDVTDLVRMRESMVTETSKKYNIRPTLTSFLIKAISLALDDFPILNSKFDAASGDSYTQYGYHNISVAMDTPNGLVVPNIKNVQDLSILQIQAELHRLQNLAKNTKLSPGDLQGGTISLSNVGVIGCTYVHALLFDGQACIIGVGEMKDLPRFNPQGELEKRKIMYFASTADHRHCDGATVARFNRRIKTLLEQPEGMLLHLR